MKRKLFMNAVCSILQVLILGLTTFLLYRFLFKTIGIEKLGIWSLVLSTTSVSGIAQLGFSGSVVKFVAKYNAYHKLATISILLQTALISIGLFIGGILFLIYPLLSWILTSVISSPSLQKAALTLLPFSLFSFWLMTIAHILQSGLDGLQCIAERSIIRVLTMLLYFILCLWSVSRYDLLGLAYAQIFQGIVLFAGYWLFLKYRLKSLPLLPLSWDKKLFKEILRYGINFQIISISAMLFDPITKSLLSKFGGLSMVGFYEMANKMIIQVRAVVVEANRVIVPFIADLQETQPQKIHSLYDANYRMLFFLSLVIFSTLIGLTPIISEVWLGQPEPIFIRSAVVLSLAWFMNMLAVPAYLSNLGTGRLRWNVISHVAIGCMNAICGIIFGIWIGGIGVIIAFAISLSIGSSLIVLDYHRTNHISFATLIPQESYALMLASGGAILCSYILYVLVQDTWSKTVFIPLMMISFLLIILPGVVLHPMVKRMLLWTKRF